MIICFQGGLEAQNLLHSNPLEYNPGFAGAKKYDRISFHANQIEANSRNNSFTYDRLVKPLKGGIGVFAKRKDIKNVNKISVNVREEQRHDLTKMGLVYTPKIILKSKFLISPSVSLSYNYYRTEITQSIKEIRPIVVQVNQFGFLNVKFGVLINSKKGHFGYTINNQLTVKENFYHSVMAGYVYSLDKKANILVDGRFNYGDRLDNYWRNYNSQVNVAYQYGTLFTGFGLNDVNNMVGLMGVKLINLKINVAYHIFEKHNMSNFEFGVQYIFDKDNKEKINLPFRKWLLKFNR